MAINISEIDGGSVIDVTVTDRLHKEDYEAFLPIVEKAIARNGKVRLLFDMQDFHGWDTAAVWEDMKFDARHFKDFERIAMVGDKTWEKAMAIFCKPFTTGKVKYFDREEKDAAVDWLLS